MLYSIIINALFLNTTLSLTLPPLEAVSQCHCEGVKRPKQSHTAPKTERLPCSPTKAGSLTMTSRGIRHSLLRGRGGEDGGGDCRHGTEEVTYDLHKKRGLDYLSSDSDNLTNLKPRFFSSGIAAITPFAVAPSG